MLVTEVLMHKLAAILVLCPALALATSTTGASTVALRWKHAGDDWNVVFAMPSDHACSVTSIENTQQDLEISMCRSGGDDRSPEVEFTLERTQHEPSSRASQELHTTVTLARGQVAQLGHFEVNDPQEELVAWLR